MQIPVKFQQVGVVVFLDRNIQADSKIFMEMQVNYTSQNDFDKEEQTLPDSKAYYKAVVIKTE